MTGYDSARMASPPPRLPIAALKLALAARGVSTSGMLERGELEAALAALPTTGSPTVPPPAKRAKTGGAWGDSASAAAPVARPPLTLAALPSRRYFYAVEEGVQGATRTSSGTFEGRGDVSSWLVALAGEGGAGALPSGVANALAPFCQGGYLSPLGPLMPYYDGSDANLVQLQDVVTRIGRGLGDTGGFASVDREELFTLSISRGSGLAVLITASEAAALKLLAERVSAAVGRE